MQETVKETLPVSRNSDLEYLLNILAEMDVEDLPSLRGLVSYPLSHVAQILHVIFNKLRENDVNLELVLSSYIENKRKG